MGVFHSELNILRGEFVNGRRKFILTEDLKFYCSEYLLNSYINTNYSSSTLDVSIHTNSIRVKAGTYTDGASIPRSCWSIIGAPFSGSYRRAAAIHDVLCRNKVLPSKLTHQLFEEMLEAEGVSGMKLKAMSKAVLWFGPKW